MLALPFGQLIGMIGVLALWIWLPMIFIRGFLALRARLWRGGGQR